MRLGDNSVTASANQREAHIVFATDELRIAGSGGCNRLIGSFEFDDNWLRFGQMAGTMMSCPDGMDLEQRFLEALKKVEKYRILGNHLELLDATDAVIARFEAVAH